MNALRSTSLVHFYDTGSHQIACGLRGFDHRSTKHARQVTCHDCVALVAKRQSLAAAGSAPAAGAV